MTLYKTSHSKPYPNELTSQRESAPVSVYAQEIGLNQEDLAPQATTIADDRLIRPAVAAPPGATPTDNKSLIAHWMQGTNLDHATVKMLEKTIIPNGTPEQINYFLIICRLYDLNPFRKEIYAWPSRDAVDAKNMMLTICISRDGLLHRAQRSPRFAGIHSSDVREHDHYCFRPAQGQIDHEITKTITDRGKVIGAYASVGRWNPKQDQILWSVAWVDLAKYKRETPVWRTHEASMITKVAEAKALKKAFGIPGLSLEDDFYLDGAGISHTLPENGKNQTNKRLESVLA